MKCVELQYSTLFALNSQPHFHRNKQLDHTQNLPCLSLTNTESLRFSSASQRQRCRFSAPTKAMPNWAHDVALSLPSSPSKSPAEITQFVATSAGLFFMYWLSNFIVPKYISKKFEVNANENQKSNSEDDDSDDDDDDAI